MKRRTALQLTSGLLFAGLGTSCSSARKKKEAARQAQLQKQQAAARLTANTDYRPPVYNQRLRNPDINLPARFNTSQVTHNKGLQNTPYVAMTFDDGPHPQNTPRLLDILRARNIKATFYVIGRNVDRYPQIARRIVAEGHEIGNHTYTHRKLTTLSDAQVRQEMSKTQNSIGKATGVRPATMRPPYGALHTRQRKEVFSEFGYPTILWSVDPEDWRRPGVAVVRSRLVNRAHNGAILLAHDLHAPTVDAMPGTFDSLLGKGYKFITVSQMLAQKGV